MLKNTQNQVSHFLSKVGNGKNLPNFLESQIRGLKWKSGYIHNFYGKGNQPLFTITPNPTKNQPGNGFVSFPYIDGNHLWNDFLKELKDCEFKKIRQNFLNKPLTECDDTRGNAANLLIQFEIARRMPGENYSLSREQTIQATNKVMATDDSNYPKMAGHLKDMYAGNDREAAYNTIMQEEDPLDEAMSRLNISNKQK